jgi:hypothetical protein
LFSSEDIAALTKLRISWVETDRESEVGYCRVVSAEKLQRGSSIAEGDGLVSRAE